MGVGADLLLELRGLAALGALLLVGCDSIKDVRSGPFTPIPPEKKLISGTI
jgi:hypothetical protein